MNIKRFYREAIRTCSNPENAVGRFNADKSLQYELYFLMKSIQKKSEKLEILKKYIYYGQERKRNFLSKVFWKLISLFFKKVQINNSDADILHGILGIIGESGGELIPVFWKGVFSGGYYDITNIIEEMGDIMWYYSPIVRGINVSPDIPLKKVILKLKKRYKSGKFSREEAINRNLEEERMTLEEERMSSKEKQGNIKEKKVNRKEEQINNKNEQVNVKEEQFNLEK